MSKKQRIAELEREVDELKQTVHVLEARLQRMEIIGTPQPQRQPYKPAIWPDPEAPLRPNPYKPRYEYGRNTGDPPPAPSYKITGDMDGSLEISGIVFC